LEKVRGRAFNGPVRQKIGKHGISAQEVKKLAIKGSIRRI